MPLASILAAITGFLMLFWRKTVSVFKGLAQFVSRTCGRLLGRS